MYCTRGYAGGQARFEGTLNWGSRNDRIEGLEQSAVVPRDTAGGSGMRSGSGTEYTIEKNEKRNPGYSLE